MSNTLMSFGTVLVIPETLSMPMLESEVKVNKVVDDGSEGDELDTIYYAHPGWSGGPTWGYVDNQPRA